MVNEGVTALSEDNGVFKVGSLRFQALYEIFNDCVVLEISFDFSGFQRMRLLNGTLRLVVHYGKLRQA